METATYTGREDLQEAVEHAEGAVARTIEEQTAKLPSDIFLWASLASMAASLGLQWAGRRSESLFIGQWAAPFLLFGIYNKLVKIGGSDRLSQAG
jgi:hypothetical protein